jgi:branched-chain amino acid transport system permease protein
MDALLLTLKKNRTLWITLAILALLFILAASGMSTSDWVITLLRGLSVGAVTFLVASGFSIIFGLLDVLNLAHGTLFMIGAYIGWTIYIRPDTFVDLLTPILLVLAGFSLGSLWTALLPRLKLSGFARRAWPWVGLVLAAALLAFGLTRYPLTSWNPDDYQNSPVTYGFQADQGQRLIPDPVQLAGTSPVALLISLLAGSLLLAFSLAGMGERDHRAPGQPGAWVFNRAQWIDLARFAALVLGGILIFVFNDALTRVLLSWSTTALFLFAVVFATLSGFGLGALLEATLVRPLYSRPIYQLMLSLGLSAIGIEIVRGVWGRPEFVMPKPALFAGSGQGCPAASLADWLAHQCSTITLLGARVRVYNEILLPIAGIVVLVAVWLLLQRSRLGMVIRAGVQDRAIVESLGINVRRVFTLVFGLGVALAALGGVLAAPSIGLSNGMGESFMLKALIALAIGGLTSFPGAAAGSFLVGLMEQFITKYGQIGISLPFLAEPFKPTPPLVPASTVLLMVIILLALPQGLFGRKE